MSAIINRFTLKKLIDCFGVEGIEWFENSFLKITKNYVVIRAGADWSGYDEHKITIDDVVDYYCFEAPNISSGCRSLADISGDWRNIDYIAKSCLEVFKAVNVEALRRKAHNTGIIEAKF